MNTQRTSRLGFASLLTIIMAVTLVSGGTATALLPTPVGDWEGKLDTGNGSLRVVLHISQAPDGKLTGTLDSPDQGANGIAIGSISYKEPDLHFEIERFGSSFDGKINKEGSEIIGSWKQGSASLPLTFERHSK